MSELKIHEAECKYRPIRCPLLSCVNEVPYFEVLKHIEENHSTTFEDYSYHEGRESRGDPLFIIKDFPGSFFASMFIYSYAHNKPIVYPFMKQNEVYLTGQNLTKSCSWPLDFCYTFVKGLDLSMLKI